MLARGALAAQSLRAGDRSHPIGPSPATPGAAPAAERRSTEVPRPQYALWRRTGPSGVETAAWGRPGGRGWLS